MSLHQFIEHLEVAVIGRGIVLIDFPVPSTNGGEAGVLNGASRPVPIKYLPMLDPWLPGA